MRLDLRRRRDVGEIIAEALRLFFAHAAVFFVATLIVVAPVTILVGGVLGEQFADGLDATPPLGVEALSLLLTSFVIPPLVTALHVRAVQGLAEGIEPTVGGVLRQALGLLPVVLPAVVLYTLGIAVGFLLLIVPGIYLSIRWYFTAQAVVVDGARGRDALRRSGELTDEAWWRVFGILLLLWIVASIIGYVLGGLLGLMVSTVSDGGAWYVLTETIGQTISLSIAALGGTLLFFDLRRGLGLEEESLGGFLPPTTV